MMNKGFNKKTIKYGVPVVLLLILMVMLVFHIIGSIEKAAMEEYIPRNPLMNLVENTVPYPGYSRQISMPTLPLKVSTPEEVAVKEGVLVIEQGDFYITIGWSDEPREEVLSVILPGCVVTPVLGYPNEGKVYYEQWGGSDGFRIGYSAYTVDTRVSIRNVTYYNVAYSIAVEGYQEELYIMVSADSMEKWGDAKELLDLFFRQVTPYEEGSISDAADLDNEKEEEAVLETQQPEVTVPEEGLEGEKPLYYMIHEIYESKVDVENGLFWITWSAKTVPEVISVYRPDGEKCPLMEVYSEPGNYVFYIGNSSAGVYTITGTTKVVLEDVWMSVTSEEGYRELNHLDQDYGEVVVHDRDMDEE